jgi:hypothetical protein
MSAAAIRERIDSEIEGIDSSAFGWDFRPCLLEVPELVRLKEHDGNMSPVWIVLRQPHGYSIVFDPGVEQFGLATDGTIVGIYGGFMDTLNAM